MKIVLLSLILALLPGALRADSAGYPAWKWPNHGTNRPGNAGGYVATLKDSSGNTVTSYTPKASHTIALSGSSFKGFIAKVFIGTATACSSNGGALVGIGTAKSMLVCSGGSTQSAATARTSQSFTWTAPAAGTGSVTFRAYIITSLNGYNYEVALTIPERVAAVSPAPTGTPTATGTPTRSPTGTPSHSPTGTPTRGAGATAGASQSVPSPTVAGATATGTSTPTRAATAASPTRTASPTPTPTPTGTVTATASQAGLVVQTGSSMLDDRTTLSWMIQPQQKTVQYSMVSQGLYWLGLARATAPSMITPTAGLALVGAPASPGGHAGSGIVLLTALTSHDMVDAPRYTVLQNGELNVESTGLLQASVRYDGQQTVFNFSRHYTPLQLSDGSYPDLAVDPTLLQGYIFARGYSEVFNGHESMGYMPLRLATPSQCDLSLCNWHGQCTAVDSGVATCTCSAGYTGPACEECEEPYSRAGADSGSEGNFTCSVNPAGVRVVVVVTLHASASTVGAQGSATRANAEISATRSIASMLGMRTSRVNVTITDAARRRELGSTDALSTLTTGVRSVLRLPRQAQAVLTLDLTIRVPPSNNASELSSVAAGDALQTAMSSGTSSLVTSLASLGLTVQAPSNGQSSAAMVSYEAEAAPAVCDARSGRPDSCVYPFVVRLTDRLAMAWRADRTARPLGSSSPGVAHFQLAFVCPSLDDLAWFGIAFDDDSGMVGGDSVMVEPAAAQGAQLKRYALSGYTMRTCPAVPEDGTMLEEYTSVTQVTDSSAFSAYPAAAALSSSSWGNGSVLMVATFSRRLRSSLLSASSVSTGGVGIRDVDPDSPVVITSAWGDAGATSIGAHTRAESAYTRLVLGTGQLAAGPAYTLWMVALHAALCMGGFLVVAPAGALLLWAARLWPTLDVPADDKSSFTGVAEPEDSPGPYAWWRRAHVQYSQLGCVLGLAGLIVGIVMTPSSARWATTHGAVGFTVLIAVLLAGVLAEAGQIVPWVKAWMHAVPATLAVGLSFYAACTGVSVTVTPSGLPLHPGWNGVTTAILAGWVLVTMYLTYRSCGMVTRLGKGPAPATAVEPSPAPYAGPRRAEVVAIPHTSRRSSLAQVAPAPVAAQEHAVNGWSSGAAPSTAYVVPSATQSGVAVAGPTVPAQRSSPVLQAANPMLPYKSQGAGAAQGQAKKAIAKSNKGRTGFQPAPLAREGR